MSARGVTSPGSGQASTMLAFDLDNPLPVDDCEVCGADHWSRCTCDPRRPGRAPTPEVETCEPRAGDANGAGASTMNQPVVKTVGTEVASLIAGLRERLPRDTNGRPFCLSCNTPMPDGEAICWVCAEQAQHRERVAEARREIVDGTRALMGQLPPWPYADVRNAEWRRRVHPRLLGVAERWVPIRGPIALLGPSEAGKTSALRALFIRLRRDALRAGDTAHSVVGAVWTSAVDYAKSRRELRRGSPDLQLDAMQHAPLLALDELGQEDAAPAWLLELLDVRYRKRRPTLTTSGLRQAQLEARYGAGIVRRLEQPGGQIVDLYGGESG